MKKRQFVLLDMDGTLIPISRKNFESALFRNMDSMFDDPEISAGVKKAMTSGFRGGNGQMTNYECLLQTMETQFGVRAEEILSVIDHHYATRYNELAAIMEGPSIAPRLLELIRRCGGIPVLATNPNSPMSCMTARMGWIGLKPSDFYLVCSAERFHYVKPDPRYFSELMEQLGATPGECLMIGNDTDEDIEAALSVGINAYLMTDYLMDRRNSVEQYTHGSSEELLVWLEAYLTEGE